MIVNADNVLGNIDVTVPLNAGVSYTTVIATLTDIESLYKAKMLRNTTSIGGKINQRMRGLYAEYTINFGSTETKINSILTRYRPSNRGI
jgi:hypothetical protein